MPQVSNDVASYLEQLEDRVRELERRISALESPGQRSISDQPELVAAAPEALAVPSVAPEVSSARMPAGVVPILGKAVLAMAGAYLLRAIAESGAIGQFPMLIAAMVYAGSWMAWAVWAHNTNHFASATYGIAATLMLAPMLWESTVRFQVLSPAFTSIVLVAFVVLVLALAWHHNLQVLPWVATLASVITAWALIFATHELVLLTASLLAIALATEVVACLGHRLSLRPVAALAVDVAVALLIYIMTSPDGVPSTYQPASSAKVSALAFGLLAIYGGSLGIRSFGLRKRITSFELAQGVAVFALATLGALRANSNLVVPALGVFFLLLSVVCYWGTLSRFTDAEQARNWRISATWAAGLLLAGSSLLLSVNVQAPFFCVVAVAAVSLYRKTGNLTLAMHASLYLAAAAVVSPFPSYLRDALAGTVPGALDWTVAIVVISAVLCYCLGSGPTEGSWTRRLLWGTPAALASFAIAALAVVGARWLIDTRFELNASRISEIRTIVTCLVALSLGFLAPRWKRVELGWIAYAAVGLGAVKLLLEDLRFGNAASLVVSLLFYGLVLNLLPRLMRRSQAQS
jgi:hypothetical protein